MKEKDIWRKGLKVFQRLGLDKTALAADNRCKLCLAHKIIQYDQQNNSVKALIKPELFPIFFRCGDLADAVTQPYEELNADMEAFEQRQKSRDSNQREAPYAVGKSNQCDSSHVKTKK